MLARFGVQSEADILREANMTLQSDLRTAQQQLASLTTEHRRLQREHESETKSHNHTLETLIAEMGKLKQMVTQLKQDNGALKSKLQDSNAQNKTVMEQQKALGDRNKRLESQVRELRSEVETYKLLAQEAQDELLNSLQHASPQRQTVSDRTQTSRLQHPYVTQTRPVVQPPGTRVNKPLEFTKPSEAPAIPPATTTTTTTTTVLPLDDRLLREAIDKEVMSYVNADCSI